MADKDYIKKFWDAGLDYDGYVKHTEEALEKATADGDEEYKHYYELSLSRMERAHKSFKPTAEQKDALDEKDFSGKVLIIAEGWCGDCSNTVPVVYKFFQDTGREVKITLRDQDPSLIHDFKTNGKEEIPKVLLFDEDFSLRGTWGSRPRPALKLLKKYKDNPEIYTKDEFYSDLVKYYIKNKGKDTIAEILNEL